MSKQKPRRPLARSARVSRVVDMQQETDRSGAKGPAGRRRWMNAQRAKARTHRAT